MSIRIPARDRGALAAVVRACMLAFVLLILLLARAFAASVSLAWDPVTNPALAGYALYYGLATGTYLTRTEVGNTTSRTIGGLDEGTTYHFAVTAYDSTRTESGYSNDVAFKVPYGVPSANFGVSTTIGVAPLALNFTNASTGAITTYVWYFGDGDISVAANPSHVYSGAGAYTVSLSVTGPGGSNTRTRINYITLSSASCRGCGRD